MRLEELRAEIRPRRHWEACDLGCVLLRSCAGRAFTVWMLTALPLMVLVQILLRNHPGIAILVLWWLKPVYGKPVLRVISGALFGAVPTVGRVLREWPRMLLKNNLNVLLWRRFNRYRGIYLPVFELEGIRDRPRRKRRLAALRDGSSSASSVTMAFQVIELVIFLALLFAVWMLIPEGMREGFYLWLEDMFYFAGMTGVGRGLDPTLIWLLGWLYIAVLTLCEPFFVASGFALYFNARTILEGWDVELVFRKLRGRLQAMGIAALVGFAVMILPPGAMAGERVDGSEAREAAVEILADDDFRVDTEDVFLQEQDFKSGDEVSSTPQYNWLTTAFRVIFYTVCAVVLAVLIFALVRYIIEHRKRGSTPEPAPRAMRQLMVFQGMRISPETLPDDVPAAALEAWERGEPRQALALLYRGAIAWWLEYGALPIRESDTESDCLRRVQELDDPQRGNYFSTLTRWWIRLAYAGRPPDEGTFRGLVAGWPFEGKKKGGSQ